MRMAASEVICLIVLLTEQTNLTGRSKMTRISVNSAHWEDQNVLQKLSSKFNKNMSEKKQGRSQKYNQIKTLEEWE